MRNVYLLITDMHRSDSIKENRISYRSELLFVDKQIFKLLQEYRSYGYNANIVFMGDLFHSGYKNVSLAAEDINVMNAYSSYCDKIYSLVGNHELTYYSSNIFYSLFYEMGSDRVKGIQNKIWVPKGSFQIINIVDRIVDGDTVIHFNHYGTGIDPVICGCVNVGLFHQDLASSEIIEDMESRFNEKFYGIKEVSLEQSSDLEGYDYCFFAHMHKIYGLWEMEVHGKTIMLQYLASLGRPNYTEVNDRFLERDIPCVVVDDGKFAGIEHHYFILPGYDECINTEKVFEDKKKYMVQKERNEIRKGIELIDDPIKDLILKSSESRRRIINDLINGTDPALEQEIVKKIFELNQSK